MDKDINEIFIETKNKIMYELKHVCPKITPVNNVGFKLDYTIYWNGSFGGYAKFAIMKFPHYYKKITLIQEVAFCARNELMSLNMIAEEMTNEVMKGYGGNRFSFGVSITEDESEGSEESEEENDDE